MDNLYKYLDSEYLKKLLNVVSKNHYQMLLISEPENLDLNPKLKKLKEEIIDWITKNSGKYYDISQIVVELLEEDISPVEIGLKLNDIIYNIISKNCGSSEPIIFDNVGLLFSKDFGGLEPIRTFKYHSRIHPIVIFVPLKLNKLRQTATFGNPGDGDYRSDIDISEIISVELKEMMADG